MPSFQAKVLSISSKPTSAMPSPAPGNPTIQPTRAPTLAVAGTPTHTPSQGPTRPTRHPTTAPTPRPSVGAPIKCPTAPTVLAKAPPVLQTLPATAWWVRNIFTSGIVGSCQGTPQMQTVQAIGQCYVLSRLKCGKTAYESYNFVYKVEKTMSDYETQVVYRVFYRDTNCVTPYSTYPVSLIVPGQCEDTSDENLSAGFVNAYFVSSYLVLGSLPPQPTINGVQTTYFASMADCRPTGSAPRTYSYMQVRHFPARAMNVFVHGKCRVCVAIRPH